MGEAVIGLAVGVRVEVDFKTRGKNNGHKQFTANDSRQTRQYLCTSYSTRYCMIDARVLKCSQFLHNTSGPHHFVVQ